MLLYYLKLAAIGLLKNRVSSSMLVITLALGIGASMTMITVVHVITQNPAPGLSSKLFYPVIEAAAVGSDTSSNGLFTALDAANLINANEANAQAAMDGGQAVITSPNGEAAYVRGHLVTSQFFRLFGVPFEYGTGWTSQDDTDETPVIVLNGDFARSVFGPANPVGKTMRLDKTDYRIVGVIKDWHPQPLFHGSFSGDYAFGQEYGDSWFIPLSTALARKVQVAGNMNCWGPTHHQPYAGDSCGWLQFWVRLDTPQAVRHYQQFLQNYWRDQRQHGRLPRPTPPHLISMMGRLKNLHLVPDDVSRQLFLALAFLAVCLLNVAGLLIAKFLRMSAQISIRRALGASRRDIICQLVCHGVLLGALGGVLGCLLTFVGILLIRLQPDHYAQLAHVNAGELFATICLAIACALVASLVPAIRASRVPPALELKINE